MISFRRKPTSRSSSRVFLISWMDSGRFSLLLASFFWKSALTFIGLCLFLKDLILTFQWKSTIWALRNWLIILLSYQNFSHVHMTNITIKTWPTQIALQYRVMSINCAGTQSECVHYIQRLTHERSIQIMFQISCTQILIFFKIIYLTYVIFFLWDPKNSRTFTQN